MGSLKEWARGVYLLAVFSSAAILLIPKRMQKQSKFVIETANAPVHNGADCRVGRQANRCSSVAWNYREHDSNLTSLKLLRPRNRPAS